MFTIKFESFFDHFQYARSSRENVFETHCNNQWIVFYNIYLLLKYDAHINVEICTSIKFVTYLYKYIFKDSNHVDVSMTIITIVNEFVRQVNHETIYRNDNDQFIDEIKIYHDVR